MTLVYDKYVALVIRDDYELYASKSKQLILYTNEIRLGLKIRDLLGRAPSKTYSKHKARFTLADIEFDIIKKALGLPSTVSIKIDRSGNAHLGGPFADIVEDCRVV
jgi:hypothetical protein